MCCARLALAPGQSGVPVNEEVGPFGRVYRQFKGKAKEAIQFLLSKKEGEAVGALSHPEIGDIDLVWGEEGTSNSDGYGLAKLAKYHPEVLDNLQEIINDMRVTKRSANRVQLESDTHQAAVRLTWDNKSKNWLLTAFEKKNSVSDNTTDTGETSNGGKQNDTATLQNTVSTDEGTTQSANKQENRQENAGNSTLEQIKAELKELAARALQDYIIRKLDDRGQKNDFLSNHVAPEEWDGDAKGYPFPLGEDAKRIADAFDNLFATLEEKTTDDGNVVLYSIAEDAMLQDKGTEAFERATKATMDAVERLKANGLDIGVVSQEEADAMAELAEMEKRKSPETALPEDESSFKGTVISSDDGANILKNIDNAIAEYENKGNSAKTFIGDVARILRAVRHGSKSEYADIVTANGIPVRIRLADHNVKVSNYDNAGINNGISIVISRKPNAGITNDGDAHLVEFFYSDKKISKADSKPLVEILKSIKQALYSGEYKDNTGLAVREEVNIPEMMTVFHGSGAKFDRFDLSKSNDRAYGYGVYAAEDKYTAKSYARKNAKSGSRQLYEVDIPDDNGSNYLRWEDEMSDELIADIVSRLPKEKLAKAMDRDKVADMPFVERVVAWNEQLFPGEGKTVETMYGTAEYALGSDKAASELLSDMGYVGISYPAEATTGGRADGARNYVIFNENDAKITNRVEFFEKNGKVYGWAVDGKIRLTPDGINPNTPVHEYAHLWGADVEKSNPKLWNEVVEAMKLSPVWNEVANDVNYSNIHGNDSRMASEVLSRLSGRENYRRTMEEAEKEIANANGVFEKAEKVSAWAKVQDALRKFWDWVQKNVFRSGKRKGESGSLSSVDESTAPLGQRSNVNQVMPWEEFANSVVGDFYKGKNPNAEDDVLYRSAEEHKINKHAEEFNKTHKGGVPVVEIDPNNMEVELAEEGFTAEEISDVKELYKKGGRAFYNIERNLIYLLDPLLDKERIYSYCWHENTHMASVRLGLTQELKDEFYSYAQGKKKDDFEAFLKKQGYEKEDYPEESLAYGVQAMYILDNWNAELLSKLYGSTVEGALRQLEIIQPLIDYINNGRQGTQGFVGENVQNGGMYDTAVQKISRKAETEGTGASETATGGLTESEIALLEASTGYTREKIIDMFGYDLNRQGNGPLTDREVVMESDPYSKVLGKPRYYGSTGNKKSRTISIFGVVRDFFQLFSSRYRFASAPNSSTRRSRRNGHH